MTSLRSRLLAAMALALATSLVVGGVLAWLGAARSVRAELRAALDAARHTVELAVADAAHERPDPVRLLQSLQGNRHLRATLLSAEDGAIVASLLPASDAVHGVPMPVAFAQLLGLGAQSSLRLPLGDAAGMVLLLETDPMNEAREAWDYLTLGFVIIVLFTGMALACMDRVLAVVLRPLEALAAACGRVGAGDFSTPSFDRTPATPEVRRLCEGFDRMASQLAAAEARDRRLRERLVTLRKAERAAIARDLHDEIGPYLFAMRVDAANVQRLAGTGTLLPEAEALHEAARNIAEAAAHAQRSVRGLLGRLRPAAPVELGFITALEELVGFWRRRRPDIAWDLAAEDDPALALDRVTAEAAYRVVQEALGNAVRHGRPGRVRIGVARAGDRLLLDIADDGGGAPPPGGRSGTGLRGMAERVASLGGDFNWHNEPGRGVTVRITLPLVPGPAAVEVS